MNEVEAYIRAAAKARGMDPDAVIRVVNTEGGTSDPFRQSEVVKNGRRERSYGPLQLYIDGGLGNVAMSRGIDPRKDWKGGVDFGLDVAAKEGWGQWYGPQNAGLPLDYGLKGAKPIGTTLNSTPITVAAGEAAPALPDPTTITDRPIAEVADAAPATTGNKIMDVLTKLTTETGEGANKASPLSKLATTMKPKEPNYVNIDPANALAASASADASRMAAGQGLMAQILAARKKRVPGLSLMG